MDGIKSFKTDHVIVAWRWQTGGVGDGEGLASVFFIMNAELCMCLCVCVSSSSCNFAQFMVKFYIDLSMYPDLIGGILKFDTDWLHSVQNNGLGGWKCSLFFAQ